MSRLSINNHARHSLALFFFFLLLLFLLVLVCVCVDNQVEADESRKRVRESREKHSMSDMWRSMVDVGGFLFVSLIAT